MRPNPSPVCLRTLGACSCPKCEPLRVFWVEARSPSGEWWTVGVDPYLGIDEDDAISRYRAESGDQSRAQLRAILTHFTPDGSPCREPVDHEGPCDPAWDVEGGA